MFYKWTSECLVAAWSSTTFLSNMLFGYSVFDDDVIFLHVRAIPSTEILHGRAS